MTSPIRRASRSNLPLKIGIEGVSGSGKTFSSLDIMYGLLNDWTQICVIDTEDCGDVKISDNIYENKKRGSDFYADKGPFSVLPISAPFSPDKYVKAIQLAINEGFKGIIIDSASHAWEAEGGILDIHNKYGGRFQDWAKANPIHWDFLKAIMSSPVHMIVTLRVKSDYAMENDGFKTTIKKVGLKAIQREGFEYDLHTVFRIEDKDTHLATIGKDRTGIFEGRPPFLLGVETGIELKVWNESAR